MIYANAPKALIGMTCIISDAGLLIERLTVKFIAKEHEQLRIFLNI